MVWRENGTRRMVSSEVRSVSQYRVSDHTSRTLHHVGLRDGSNLTRIDTQSASGLVIGYVGQSTLSWAS